MKTLLIASALLGGALFYSTPSMANGCINCLVQSKTPSSSAPGKFEFRVVCIELLSGDEISSLITASSEEEALNQMNETKCK